MSSATKTKTGKSDETIVLKGPRYVPAILLALAVFILLGAGIDWKVLENGHPLFSNGGNDFKDVDQLVDKLNSPDEKDALSQFVWSQFSRETKEALSWAPLPPQLKEKLLVRELNKIVNSDVSIYSDQFFPNGLSSNIESEKKFVEKSGGDRALLNRLLLEYAYQDEINSATDDSKWLTKQLATGFRFVFGTLYQDIPVFIRAQIRTIWILALCSLLPGLAGLIYRRAFGTWFVSSFALLYLLNWLLSTLEWGVIGGDLIKSMTLPYRHYFWVEVLVIVVLLAFFLRRSSASIREPGARKKNIAVSFFVSVVALAWIFLVWFNWLPNWLPNGVSLTLLLPGFMVLAIAAKVFWQTLRSTTEKVGLGKNIVVCFDGTWNQPGQKDYGYLAETNVFKLFKLLTGKANTSRKKYHASQYKEYVDKDEVTRQIAFYFHGVGNAVENSQLGQLFGGVFGMGAEAVVERAYLDVLSVYRPGDRIFVFGFSRGAAIARLFAGRIGHEGLPTSQWTLHLFGRHFTIWKPKERQEITVLKKRREDCCEPEDRERIQKEIEDLKKNPGPWMSLQNLIGWCSERHKPRVAVLGCWDTVGSFGISKNILGIPFQEINLLKDLTVSDCVERAYHMVALDETRDAFEPTLMDPDPIKPNRIIEVWFSGNHSNVGGGYATDRLSDVALDFLLRHVSEHYATRASGNDDEPQEWFRPQEKWFPPKHPDDPKDWVTNARWGLHLKKLTSCDGQIQVNEDDESLITIDPHAGGRLRESTGAQYSFAPRKLPIRAVIYDTVFERMKKVVPVYAPQSLFDLNEELSEKRKPIEKEVKRREQLRQEQENEEPKADVETERLENERLEKEWREIRAFSNNKLKLMKWSEYLKQEVDVLEKDKTRTEKALSELLNPATELSNPPSDENEPKN